MSSDDVCLIGVDVGTSSVKVGAFDSTGHLLARSRTPTPTSRPRTGWAEHSPDELWAAVAGALRATVEQLPAGYAVEAVATASMGEAGAPLAGDGRVLRPVIAWFDTRAGAEAASCERAVGAEAIYGITGQTVDAHYGVNKLLWVLNHEPDVAVQTRRWLSVADLVVWWLSGEQGTDPTIAARTMLLDRHQRSWSDELLTAFGIEPALLPPVYPSGTMVGSVTEAAAAATGLRVGTPVAVGGHDHLAAALVARGGRDIAVDSAGTAESLLLPVVSPLAADRGRQAHVTCYPDVLPDRLILSAQVGLAGGLVDWLRREVFGIQQRRDLADHASVEAMWQPHDPLNFSGVVCHPTFGRGISPDWESEAPFGAFLGLTIGHSRHHLLQAVLEGNCFSLRASIEWMHAATTTPIGLLRTEGGTTASQVWMQLKADITACPLEVIRDDFGAARGAAVLAGAAAGIYRDARAGAQAMQLEVEIIQPDSARSAEYARVYEQIVKPLRDGLRPLNRLVASGRRDLCSMDSSPS